MKLLLILGAFLCLAKGHEHEATLKSLVVTSDIKVRYARTMVSAEYYNNKNSAAPAHFHVILPDRAYISNFSMEVNGEVSVGEVKEKEKAQKIFDAAVERGESAAHVFNRHRFTKRFDMKVNVEPNAKVVFNLTYEELLKRTHGNYTHKIFLSNGKVIDRLFVEVFISEPQDIKVFGETIDEDLRVRSVDYIDNRHVYIKFDPSRREQRRLLDSGFNGDFLVEYDVDRNNKSNLIYTLDGYFVHFFTPEAEPVWPKNVVFMIDVSGSMLGRKLRQVKSAMRGILSSLDPQKDSFTVGTFSHQVKWQHSKDFHADDFIDSLKAAGGTNINLAMLSSLEKLKKEKTDTNMADILFFLTDGEPTSGVTNKEIIRHNIRKENDKNVMIFTLGFGEDCDHQFLQYIASDNSGTSRKIYIDSDSDQQIKNMFNEISNLLLKNVIITYVDESIDVGHVTRNEFKTIFKGSEIAIAGPVTKGAKTITAEIKAENAQKTFVERQKLEFIDFEFDDVLTFEDIPSNPNLTKLGLLQDMTKKTWAYLTIRKMIEENAAPEDIVDLALQHGFVTPYTSMVVTKQHLQGQVSEEGKKKPKKQMYQSHLPKPTDSAMVPPPPRAVGSQSRFASAKDTAHMLPDRNSGVMVQSRRRVLIQATPKGFIQFGNRKFAKFHAQPPVTKTPTKEYPEQTTTTEHPPTTSSPSTIPHLQKLPALVVKPAKCNLTLCVSQSQDCINEDKVLLLKDLRADVEIYGESEKSSSVTCMDNLYKLTLKSRRRHIEITPNMVTMNNKRLPVTNRDSIRFRFKNFFHVAVIFNRDGPKKTVSIRIIVRDHLLNAQGFYGEYMKRFHCKIEETGEVTLSHMERKFKKVSFTSPRNNVEHCYI